MTLLGEENSARSGGWFEKVVWLATDCQQMSPMSRIEAGDVAGVPGGLSWCLRVVNRRREHSLPLILSGRWSEPEGAEQLIAKHDAPGSAAKQISSRESQMCRA